mmetsp:Transcript_38821/g.68182  ORF Transcript_38821/g.68182 Transcript_38821/m.68182 type:complete len:280 (+) Transcript_38821:81-920(+)
MNASASYQGPTSEQKAKAIAAAKMRTEDPLKNWPKPPREDCPLCLLPFPHEEHEQQVYFSCCGSAICGGCNIHQFIVTGKSVSNKDEFHKVFDKCPFCRLEIVKKTTFENQMKLANAGRHRAMYNIAGYYLNGKKGLQKDSNEALKWYHLAMDAGNPDSAMALAVMFMIGQGVRQDYNKTVYYFQKASDLGMPEGFAYLAVHHMTEGEVEEGYMNFRRAAMCGSSEGQGSVFKALREGFMDGCITKDEYAFTLRANQAARDEMSSEWRDISNKIKDGTK